VQLPPGDAQHAVALDLEGAVSGAVVLERAGGRVGLAAVELDHEPLIASQRVDGVGADGVVRLRPREAVGVEQGEEADLELALGDRGSEVLAVDDRPSAPPSPGVRGVV
jgi:hypothetical protein